MYNLDKISNEALGAKVRRNMEKRREYVAQQTPFWQKEGAAMQATRTGMGISQRAVSELIGVSTQTLINLKRTLSLEQFKETPERE